ncbi:MAG: transposase [Candidatus Cloacimonetes bacterium]|nr:transposase [Candidatus Cloacimonadota bacterium]MBL7149738.1 transposase [Candidatus Cloacimonadota bacterium]
MNKTTNERLQNHREDGDIVTPSSRWEKEIQMYKRFLPHIQPENAIIFITYRLAFSLPQAFYLKESIRKIKSRMQKEIHKNFKKRKEITAKYEYKLFLVEDLFYPKISNSPQWLMEKSIVEIVEESLLWGHQKRYELFSYCIMPNHIHILIRPMKIENENKFYELKDIMYSHKRFTAREANKILNRKGDFWYREFYDHYIRNEKEFRNVLRYIYHNPVKAGLVSEPEDWRFNKIMEL